MPSDRSKKIPRPPNAFIIYRMHTSDKIRLMYKGSSLQSKLISKIAGLAWNVESTEIRQAYNDMADVAKQEHRIRYPGYHFEPRRAKEAAGSAERTRARVRDSTKEAKRARKGRKATIVYGAASPTPSLSPSTPASLSLSTVSLSQPQSLAPSPLPTPPPVSSASSISYGATPGPYKQPWMNNMLAVLNELPPQARVEAMRRIRMLNTVTSAFPVPQGLPSYPMEHGQRAGAYGPPPNHPYQTYNCTAAQSLPPTMFPHGAMPPIGVPCLGMNSLGLSDVQQAAWSQSLNFNLGYNSFAGPVPEYAPDYVLNSMRPIPEPGPSFSRTVPWSSNEGCDTDHAIHILDSPAQAPMSLYDPLDVSSIPSVVPAVGVCESQSAMVTTVQSMHSDAVPELSNTDLAELASFVLTRIESSPVPAPSSLGFTSAEDPPTQDPLETLPHDHIWPQELDDWMGAPPAAA